MDETNGSVSTIASSPSRHSPSFHREQKILRGLCGRSPGVGSPKLHIRATGRQQLGAALIL